MVGIINGEYRTIVRWIAGLAIARGVYHRMSDNRCLAQLVVVESRPVAGKVLTVVDSLAGEVSAGMRLEVSDTGERWEVQSLAFAPISAIEQGRQGLLLVPLDQQQSLTPGTHLEQAPVAVVRATD